ncbi:MAG: type II toxin-antitoxin system HicA family toxin [Nitrospirae bacterium]|nr:type II toxin-antitoxin system HicA family toxin [Nitrospirota bacterium]
MMQKFPNDCLKRKVIYTFEKFGFNIIREREHISMERENPDGSKTYLTIPNHRYIKASTLRTICTQVGISREDFVKTYETS